MTTATETNGVAARHSSESAEHYSPSLIVEAGRAALGGFDLDPASCETANRTVKARDFFTSHSNGFTREWYGRTWLNPPGGRCDAGGNVVAPDPEPVKAKRKKGFFYLTDGAVDLTRPCVGPAQAAAKAWWFKLAGEFVAGRVKEAIFVGFSVEIIQTTQVDVPPGLPRAGDGTLCFPARRIAYVRPDGIVGASPPHASVIVYLGPRGDYFRAAFAPIGLVIGGDRG